ncbi:hypothetical protein EMCRGX_G004785 [Ephydatia muelleri]
MNVAEPPKEETAQLYCANCQKSTLHVKSSTNVAVLILSNFFQLILLAITVLRIDYQLCFWSGYCPSAAGSKIIRFNSPSLVILS